MMKKIKRSIHYPALIATLMVAASFVNAATKEKEDKYPLGCKDVGYQFELKPLTLLPEEAGERQSLYFIFNALPTNINLYQIGRASCRERVSSPV